MLRNYDGDIIREYGKTECKVKLDVVKYTVNLAGRDLLEGLGFQLRRFSSSNTNDDKVNIIVSIDERCQPRQWV